MKAIAFLRPIIVILLATLLFPACANYPTLVEVARKRQNPGKKDDPNADFKITDRDVIGYTDRIKVLLSSKFSQASGLRYGSSATQATLGALAAAASTAGWAVSTASGLGLGATFVYGLGQSIDAKGHAQAYEQAFSAIQSAESTYYFFQVGMRFKRDGDRVTVELPPERTPSTNTIPSPDRLTPDGQTLYYRVTKILRVLNDVLANKIPNLQDLKDAEGDSPLSTSLSNSALRNAVTQLPVSLPTPNLTSLKRKILSKQRILWEKQSELIERARKTLSDQQLVLLLRKYAFSGFDLRGDPKVRFPDLVRRTSDPAVLHAIEKEVPANGPSLLAAPDLQKKRKELIIAARDTLSDQQVTQILRRYAAPDFDLSGDPKVRLQVLISHLDSPILDAVGEEITSPKPLPTPAPDLHQERKALIQKISSGNFTDQQATLILGRYAGPGFDLTGPPKVRLQVLISHEPSPEVLTAIGNEISLPDTNQPPN